MIDEKKISENKIPLLLPSKPKDVEDWEFRAQMYNLTAATIGEMRTKKGELKYQDPNDVIKGFHKISIHIGKMVKETVDPEIADALDMPKIIKERIIHVDNGLDDEENKSRFVYEVFYMLYKIKNWIYRPGFSIPYSQFILGNDDLLLYWYQCIKCGSFIGVDWKNPEREMPILCEHCIQPVDNSFKSPWIFFHVGTDLWNAAKEELVFNWNYTFDKSFKRKVDNTVKRLELGMKITKPFKRKKKNEQESV